LEGVDRITQVDHTCVIRIRGIFAARVSCAGKKIGESGYPIAQVDAAVTIRIAAAKPVTHASEASKTGRCWQRDQADHQECIFYQKGAPEIWLVRCLTPSSASYVYGYFTFGCHDKQEMFAAGEAWQVAGGARGSLRPGWAPGIFVAAAEILPAHGRG
jgi:hypothetical protein